MNFKKRCCSYGFLCGVVAMLIGIDIAHATSTEDARLIRVGVYENAPRVHLSRHALPTGVLGDVLVAIAQEENWTLQVVPCTWNACLDALNSGRIDLLPDVAHNEERKQLYDFHRTPALHSWSQVFARDGSVIRSVLDLQDKTVAVLLDSVQHRYLATLGANFGSRANLLGVSDLAQGFEMVANGKADAVSAGFYNGALHAKKHGLVPTPVIFLPSELYYAASKGFDEDILETIDKHLLAWQADPTSVYFDALRRWGSGTVPPIIPASLWWVLSFLGFLLVLASGGAAFLKAQVTRKTESLKASEARLNAILDSVDAHIYIKDCKLRYLYGNRKVCEFFGVHPTDLVGLRDDDFFQGEQLTHIRSNDLLVLDKGQRVAVEEGKPDGNRGLSRSFFSIKIPLRDRSGHIESLCGISTDITEHKAAQEAAHKLAFYDSLTALPNRRLMHDHMAVALDEIARDGGVGALLFIDLDNFKRINDAQGHAIGDTVLCSVAQRLSDIVRTEDTVARVGGDEFVILLASLARSTDDAARAAMGIAESVRSNLEQPFIVEGKPYFSGASIGITLLRPDGKTTDDVMREADTAMYRSKEWGRNRVAFFEIGMQTEIQERLALEHDLSVAIGSDQLQMHVQPQVGSQGNVVGAELLIRWHHPTQGNIPPSRFIPIAEETGIILRVGDWALQQACAFLLQLEATGDTHPVSVNVSPRQFRQVDFVSRVREILQETKAPSGRLIFEVTEGILIEDMQSAIDKMTELTRMGIRFSIDDFGTGYSNLMYLKRLPLYELKIDKSFVHDAVGDPDSLAIVKLILAMAHQLNLTVVAEGVETSDQAQLLIQNGCNAMQGYFYSRPMPVTEWLNRTALPGP